MDSLTSLSRAIFILGSMVIMAAIILNVVIAILEQGGMFTLGAMGVAIWVTAGLIWWARETA